MPFSVGHFGQALTVGDTSVFWASQTKLAQTVSDSLQYSPEQCTIIAMYKKMVVGVALLSSPIETYINYLAVKPGWDNAQIATYAHSPLGSSAPAD